MVEIINAVSDPTANKPTVRWAYKRAKNMSSKFDNFPIGNRFVFVFSGHRIYYFTSSCYIPHFTYIKKRAIVLEIDFRQTSK